MLFGCQPGKGLKPMSIMSAAVFDGPFLHFVGNHICGLKVEVISFFDRFLQLLVHLLWKAFLHHMVVEDI